MLTKSRLNFSLLIVLALLIVAASKGMAQPNVSSTQLTPTSSPIITASSSGDTVRITAPGYITHIRLEVFSSVGEKVFDSGIQDGNVLDWRWRDQKPFGEESYLCLVAVQSLSGMISRRIANLSFDNQKPALRSVNSADLSPAQVRALSVTETDTPLTIINDDQSSATSVLAHDGMDGQIIRSRGALTFHIGNFFTGLNREQMRLTEGGNLGIGTSDPQSKLDVAGTIRAHFFLVVKPNRTSDTKLTSPNMAQTSETTDSVEPLASGTGTQDHIAKWTDNSGSLGDSILTESGSVISVANGRLITTGTQTLSSPGGMFEIATTVTNNDSSTSDIKLRNTFNGSAATQQALDVAPTFAPSTNISLARGFISTAFFAPPSGVTITDGYGGNANTAYNNTGGAVINGTAFAIRSPLVFGTLRPTSQYGLRILNQGIAGTSFSYGLYVDAQSGSINNYSAVFAGGNVGIGTTNPTTKLHVIGDSKLEGNVYAGATTSFLQLGSGASSGSEIKFFNLLTPFFSIYSIPGGSPGAGRLTIADTTAGGAGTPLMSIANNGNVGIGTISPGEKLHVIGNGLFTNNLEVDGLLNVTNVSSLLTAGNQIEASNILSINQTGMLMVKGPQDSNHGMLYSSTVDGPEFRAFGAFRWTNGSGGAVERMRLDANGNLGLGGVTAPTAKLQVNGTGRFSMVNIDSYVGGQDLHLCTTASGGNQNLIGLCSSSLRYKRNVQSFSRGLEIITRLRPISFEWKESGKRDVGLAAEEVEKVEPLLTFRNNKNEIEGVKYSQLSAIFINAFKQQQAQIESQKEQMAAMKAEIDALKQLVCAANSSAAVCNK
jgi:hypothetical protein